MKQNIKNQLLILLLLITMMFVVFTGVLVISLSPNMIVNIIIIIAMILLTFFIFILMKYLNKKLIYNHKKLTLESIIQRQVYKISAFFCGDSRYKSYI